MATAGSSVTLSTLVNAIDGIIQDPAYTSTIISQWCNKAVLAISGGIHMPDGSISPPLPDLYDYATVATATTLAYVSLPSDYQRNVVLILDSSGDRISAPSGGDYYAFNLFLEQVNDKKLAETGSVYKFAVRGAKLYYQGIPAISETIAVHYYRRPVDMALDGDTPDGIPEHLQERLIKHYVCKEIFGEAIEDGQDNTGIATKYHTGKFFEDMTELVNFIGIDAGPQYYGDGGFVDRGNL
jgi:hypothetical protein